MHRLSLLSLSPLLLGVSTALLSKPPLQPNLDNLNQGLMDHLHCPSYTLSQWAPGWIAQDCATITSQSNLNPADVQTYNVQYADCSEAWIICRHKDSPSPLTNLIDRFGKLPVLTRQWVRHIIALPDPAGGHAFNSNGNIAMFNIIDDMDVFVHESGHSLDLLGAYADKPLSSSANWINNYNQDTNVPDPYSQTNQVENVAQNTVVASFNENVPGKFQSVDPKYGAIFHQFATIITEARNAGQADGGASLITPGGPNKCTKRLANSPAVHQSSSKRSMRATRQRRSEKPDVSLSEQVEVIPPKEFHTGEDCKKSW